MTTDATNVGIEPAQISADLKRLAFAGVCFVVFSLFLIGLSAPHEGDSSEFASIARTLLRDGELREDFLKEYARSDLNISHAPTARSAFFPFLVAPFYMVFRESIWTLALPGALAFFFTPLLTYLVGIRFFSRDVAYWAALFTLFNAELARILIMEEPCQPEMAIMPLYLLTALLVLKKRHVLSGAVFALALLVKQSSMALLGAAVLWSLTYDRSRERLAGLAKFLAVALLIMSPFLARNYKTFGSPFFSEAIYAAPAIYNELYERTLRGDLMSEMLDYEFWTDGRAPSLGAAETLKRVAAFTLHHIDWTLFGRMTDQGFHQGLVEIFSLFLFLLMAAGVVAALGEKRAALISLVLLLHVFLILQAPASFFRYLIPVFPFGMLLGLNFLEKKLHKLRMWGKPLFYFVFMTEIFVFGAITTLRYTSDAARSPNEAGNFDQMRPMCEWLGPKVDRRDVVVGFPYSSLHFLCDVRVAAFPSGPLDVLGAVIGRYKPDYFYYFGEWRGDRFPRLPGMTPVASSGRVALFSIDRERAAKDDETLPADFDLHRYFWSSRVRFEAFPPFLRSLRLPLTEALLGGKAVAEVAPAYRLFAQFAGWVAAAAIWWGLFMLFAKAVARSRAVAVGCGLLLATLGIVLQFAHMIPMQKTMPQEKPPASVAQTFGFIERRVEEGLPIQSIGTNMPADFYGRLIKAHPDRERYENLIQPITVTGNLAFDADLNVAEYDALMYFEKMPERPFENAQAVEENHRDMQAYLANLDRIARLSSLKGRNRIAFNGGWIFY